MKTSWEIWLQRLWYGDSDPPFFLKCLAALFAGAVRWRRLAYRLGWKKSESLWPPVIVVGNLTVGGTGKTPLVIWLAEFFKAAGYQPGIISRGYGGKKSADPIAVLGNSDPRKVGDEPVMIAQRTGCPVFVHPQRVVAGRALLQASQCDILIADDGLQHYALARDLEIAVVDGERRFGNGRMLPAGPLREPLSRLANVDFVVCRGGSPEANEVPMGSEGDIAMSLAEPNESRPLAEFVGRRVVAVAGIGDPERFFRHLRQFGIEPETQAYPDHHVYSATDIQLGDPGTVVLMTEKDAVKCRNIADERHWYVPVQATLPETFGRDLANVLKAKCDGKKVA